MYKFVTVIDKYTDIPVMYNQYNEDNLRIHNRYASIYIKLIATLEKILITLCNLFQKADNELLYFQPNVHRCYMYQFSVYNVYICFTPSAWLNIAPWKDQKR